MPKWIPYQFTTEQAWDNTPGLQPDSVCRVLAVGDIHGEIRHLRNAVARAAELDVQAIVQIGDFWLDDAGWDRHGATEAKFMWAAHGSRIPIIVVDGNHEAWPSLRRYWQMPDARTAVASRRPLHLGGSLWWAWRGSVWQWAYARCGALGGAVSPDREDRDVRRWRWPEEATTQDDLDRLIRNAETDHAGQLDVLFTHDAPEQVRGLVPGISWAPPAVQASCNENRRLLADAVDHTEARLVIHGHWHQANRENISPSAEVIGLSNDGRPDHLALLTLDDPPRCEHLP